MDVPKNRHSIEGYFAFIPFVAIPHALAFHFIWTENVHNAFLVQSLEQVLMSSFFVPQALPIDPAIKKPREFFASRKNIPFANGGIKLWVIVKTDIAAQKIIKMKSH